MKKIDSETDIQKKYESIPINKYVVGDCLEILKKIPDNTFDLIVTSPQSTN